jgi:hypothetical protein
VGSRSVWGCVALANFQAGDGTGDSFERWGLSLSKVLNYSIAVGLFDVLDIGYERKAVTSIETKDDPRPSSVSTEIAVTVLTTFI